MMKFRLKYFSASQWKYSEVVETLVEALKLQREYKLKGYSMVSIETVK